MHEETSFADWLVAVPILINIYQRCVRKWCWAKCSNSLVRIYIARRLSINNNSLLIYIQIFRLVQLFIYSSTATVLLGCNIT